MVAPLPTQSAHGAKYAPGQQLAETLGARLVDGVGPWLGAVLVGLGGVVIYGWVARLSVLLQVRPEFGPMQLNTALCFVASGLALSAQSRGAGRWAEAFAWATAGLALLTLVQYPLGVDLGIDELLLDHYLTTKTPNPGRMAPNTAICFALSASSVVALRRARWGVWLASAAGSVVAAFGVVALFGYVSGVEAAYGWGTFPQMAIHTASGFAVLGLGLAVLARNAAAAQAGPHHPALEHLPLATLLFATALGLSYALAVSETQLARRDAQLEASRVAAMLNGDLSLRVPALDRMARRLADGDEGFVAWQRDAERTVADEPSYRALLSVGADGAVIGAAFGAPGRWRSDSSLREWVRGGLAELEWRDGPRVTAPVSLDSGELGFLIVAPVPAPVAAARRILLVGVVSAARLVDHALSAETPGYYLAVSDGEALVYASHSTPVRAESGGEPAGVRDVLGTATLSPFGRTWTVSTWPGAELAAASSSSMPWLVFAFTSALGLLVPALSYHRARARAASERLDRANAELEMRLADLDAVLGACPSGIVMVDEGGALGYLNAEAERLFGYRAGELSGQPVEVLVPESLREAHARRRRAFQRSPTRRPMGEGRELTARRKDGSEFEVAVGLSPVRVRDGQRVLVAVHDVSDRKRAERLAADRAKELERSNAELERFAYVASHDLKEPLRMVVSFTQLLQQRCADQLDERGSRYVENAVAGGKRMQRLLEDLLAYARAGGTSEPCREVDAAEALSTALSDLSLAIGESGAEVTHGELPRVVADPRQLSQVFFNLVGNAIKFRRPEQVPRVVISAERVDGAWRFSVRDNGIGLDSEHFESIFRPFHRLHSRDEYEGTGVGLSLVDKLVHAHGGRVWVESKKGEGSTFFFTLPAGPPPG